MSQRPGPAIVKLGGSVMANTALDGMLAAIIANGSAVIVPGGGVFADAVREAQGQLGFSDSLAHRLALDAMRAFAVALVERDSRLALARRNDFASMLARGRVPVWDASELAGHPAIPETWDVTSDSLAAWLAVEIGARTLILVKSANPDDPAEDFLDKAFPVFASRLGSSPRFTGPDPSALAEALAIEAGEAPSSTVAEDHDD